MKFAGTYDLVGDRLIFHSPPTTSRSCSGSNLVTEDYPGRSDTTTVRITGNLMTVLQKPETFSSDNGGEAVIQRFTESSKVSGKSGIQGIWKETHRGYAVVSGTPSPAIKTALDQRMLLANEPTRYLSHHIEFTDDTAWSWMEGDFAGFFLAEWNGEISSLRLELNANERFDVQVRAVDPRKVELLGLKNGEKVTATFEGPLDVSTYASDQPGREPYKSSDFLCPFDGAWNWYEDFLEMNLK